MTSESPITCLVKELDGGPSPFMLRGKMSAVDARIRIYRAASEELAYKQSLGRAYDPAADSRFKWLLEWAEVLEGVRQRFTPGLHSCMRFLFMPVDQLLSPRDLQAGERPEPTQTLCKGHGHEIRHPAH